MKKILSFLFAILFASSMMADSYTISFKDGGGDSDKSTGLTSTTVADYVAEGADYVSAIAPDGKVYYAKTGAGLKFGNSSNGGKITLTLASAIKPTSIVVSASQFGAKEGTGLFQGETFDMTAGGGKYSFNDYTVSYDGNTEVTTIEVGTQTRGYVNSITVNYGEGGGEDPNPQPSDEVWSIAGSSAALFGAAWDPASAPEMTKQNDGTYLWQSAEVALGKGDVQFKVVKGHAWGEEYPKNDDGSNYKLDIPEDASYIVTITFNPETKEIGATAEKVGSVEIQHTAAIRGLNKEWDKGLELILAQDGKSAEASIQLASGDQEFKVVVDGSQWRSNAGTFTRENTSVENLTGNDNTNMKLQADVAGEYSFKWIFDGDVLIITFPEKSGDDPVDPITPAGDKFVKVTAAPSDWSGYYLFVNDEASVAFNGGADKLDAVANIIPVEITEDVIPANDATKAAVIKIDAVEGGYSVQAANGKYIGVTAYANSLLESETPYVHNCLKIDDLGRGRLGIFNEDWTNGDTMLLSYNSASNQTRFRYYKRTNIKTLDFLYRLVESGDTPVDPQPEVAHYLIGNAAEMGGWNIDNALPMDGDSIDLDLEAGGYAFKIVPSKAWNQPGQLDCNAIAEGQEKLSCDNSYNISFSMPSAAKVTIKVLENKVYVLGIPDGEIVVPDTHYLIGDSAVMGGWDFEKAPFMDGDSIKLTLPAGIYMFKIVAFKAWDQPGQLDCSNLAEGQENVGCEGQGNDQKNVKLYLAEQATITIKIIDGKIYVFGIPGTVDPQPGETKYYMKNNWNGGNDWYWLEMEQDPAEENLWKLEAVFGGNGVNYNTEEDDQTATWVSIDDLLMNPQEPVQALDTVLFLLDTEAGKVSAQLIGRPGGDTPIDPQPEDGYIFKWDANADNIIGLINYGAQGAAVATTKIHKNTDEIPAINLSKSYKVAEGILVSIKPAQGKFLKGDKISFATLINNATDDGSKYGAVHFYGDDLATKLFEGQNGINGRTTDNEPIVESFVLEADQDSIAFGRYGNTATFVSLLTVVREGGDTPQPQPEVKYSLKNNWDGGTDWYYKEMEKKAEHLWKLENVVLGTAGVNLISDEKDYVERWYAADGEYKFTEFSDAIQAGDTVSFDWDPVADTLCAKIVGKYIPGETPQTRYFLKNNWDGGEWRWKEMSAVPTVENYWQLQDVFGGTGVNLNTQASDEGQQWFPLDKIVGGDLIQAEDTVLFVYNAVDGTLAARLIGRPGGDTPGPQDPSAAIAISLLQWVPVPFTLSEDKSYATLSYRIPAGEYEFKMVINGAYRSNGYNFHRGYTGVAGLVDNVDANMTLQADVAGEYTIIWVFATDSIEFRFPEKPDEPTEMVDLRLVPGVWNTADAKFACLTLNEIPSSFSEDNIAEFIASATISNWFVGGDTVIGKIPADTKLLAFGRFNPAVEGDAPTIQDIMNTEMLWNHSDILMIDQSMIYTISAWEAEGGSDYSPGYWGDKPVEPSLADGVYIAGTMNNWTPSKDYVFKENEAQPGEYILQIDLSEGDEFKIVYISSGQEIWLPAGGEDTNIKVTAEYAGRVTIYFRPLGNPEWPAYYYYIVVEQEQGLNNINAAGKTVKMIQNGQILILKGDKTYNVLGTLVK